MNRRSLIIVLCSLVVIFGLYQARGMDRWSALSQIESGNNDYAMGRLGEITRYQIRPDLWLRYAGPKATPFNPVAALRVTKEIIESRMRTFKRIHGRAPTDFEFYILWNAPAEVDNPSPAVFERAARFRNLCGV